MNINSILIFYGSAKEFQKKLPDDFMNFTELIYKHENFRQASIMVHYVPGENQIPLTPPEFTRLAVDNLVIESSEFASVTEHVITNFLGFLSEIDISNIFIQNPPKLIVEQLKKVTKNIEVSTEKYSIIKKQDLLTLDNQFNQKIIGQTAVKKKLLKTLFPLTKAYKTKPVVILFYGKTGVGKTETAIFLANLVKQKVFRTQFSMYQNDQFSNYLFGGRYNERSFAKDLLDRESNIILLDEFDKANPMFFSAFYQLFDEGIYEDNNYHVVLEKSIIICTSNFENKEQIEKHLGSAIANRFDALIKFDDLTDEDKQKIGQNAIEKFSCLFDLNLPSEIKDNLVKAFKDYENVRQINNLVEETYSYYELTKTSN